MSAMQPKALIMLATGTNRDRDAAQALALAGAETEIVPLKYLLRSSHSWKDRWQMLVIAGGFSYADALGAGRLLALDLLHYFSDQADEFVSAGKPVIGICNGFQALVKAGLLPFTVSQSVAPAATLTFNQCGHFECRWVTLKPVSQTCIWTRGLNELVDCPVAHGEGNFVVRNLSVLADLRAADQVALTYVCPDGSPANGVYPDNPNGSLIDLAGICNPAGNVLGLMPHPEDNVSPFQHPDWMRGVHNSGLPLFKNGVRYAQEM